MEYPRIKNNQGFAMLFTVLIVSLILTIAVGISNLTLRQVILSGLARDSGIAFYQADAGVECGMYQDVILTNFPYAAAGVTPTPPPTNFMCGDQLMTLDSAVSDDLATSRTNFYRYIPSQDLRESNLPCFTITFNKTNLEMPGGKSAVRSSGYSSCVQSPRQVERLLQVTY